MWTCPKCERNFRVTNQSHMCVDQDLDRLFEGRPEELILAFDQLLVKVIDWKPNSVGASIHTIVFTNKRCWLVVRPMSKVLDVKFYLDAPLHHERVHNIKQWSKHYAHHIRIQGEHEIDETLLKLLRKGYDYGLR